jgi:hypothetical protein
MKKQKMECTLTEVVAERGQGWPQATAQAVQSGLYASE